MVISAMRGYLGRLLRRILSSDQMPNFGHLTSDFCRFSREIERLLEPLRAINS